MPIRTAKQHSDRGSIKDLVNQIDSLYDSSYAPTDEELKLKNLYEHAQATNDEGLQSALGFIVMPQAGDRSAFPITVYRHREYVNSLSKKIADKIEKTKKELEACFNAPDKTLVRIAQLKQVIARQTVLSSGTLIKIAGTGASGQKTRSFRRVR
jgi:hypothetical protein